MEKQALRFAVVSFGGYQKETGLTLPTKVGAKVKKFKAVSPTVLRAIAWQWWRAKAYGSRGPRLLVIDGETVIKVCRFPLSLKTNFSAWLERRLKSLYHKEVIDEYC